MDELRSALGKPYYLYVRSGYCHDSVISLADSPRIIGEKLLPGAGLSPKQVLIRPGSASCVLQILDSSLKTFIPRFGFPGLGLCSWKSLSLGSVCSASRVFKVGNEVIGVEQRPRSLSYCPPRLNSKFSWSFFLYIPVLFFLPLSLSHYLDWRIIFSVMGTLLMITVIFSLAKRPSPPRADQLALCLASFLLSSGSTPHSTGETDPPIAWLQTPKSFSLIRKNPKYKGEWGERICFLGKYAQETACWWGLQVFLAKCFHAKLIFRSSQDQSSKQQSHQTQSDEKEIFWQGKQSGKEKFTITITAPDLDNPQGNLIITWAEQETEIPKWANKVIPAKNQQVPSKHWWKQIMALGREKSSCQPPQRVLTQDILPELLSLQQPTPLHKAVLDNWLHSSKDSLNVVVGRNLQGDYWLDLVKSGPHALLAGTTGSGKSAALTTWLLAMAMRYSPENLQYVLVDYKGGEAFKVLEQLPHTFGVLSNLDPQITVRALQSLGAEITFREQYQQQHHNLSALKRIVVVVDEFKILSQEHPEVLDALIRLAILGRSLKIHLILATQHPNGCIDQQIRANMALKICLRVLANTDSNEVIGDNRAAQLPPIPGRAWVQHGSSDCVQFAFSGDKDFIPQAITSIKWAEKALLLSSSTDFSHQTRLAYHPKASPHLLWLPELPRKISCQELVDKAAHPDNSFLIGLADYPQQQRQSLFYLEEHLNLIISGESSSGRTNLARVLAYQGIKQGKKVYFLTSSSKDLTKDSNFMPTDELLYITQDLQVILEVLRQANLGLLQAVIIIDQLENLLERFEHEYTPLAFPQQLAQLCRQNRQLQVDLAVCTYPESINKSYLQGLTQILVGKISNPLKVSQTGFNPLALSRANDSGLFIYNPQETNTLIRIPLFDEKELLNHDQNKLAYPPRRKTPIPKPALSLLRDQVKSTTIKSLPFSYQNKSEKVLGMGLSEKIFLPDTLASWIVIGEAKTGKTNALEILAQAYPQARVIDDYEYQHHLATSQSFAQHIADVDQPQYLISCTPDTFLQCYQGLLARLKQHSNLLILGTYPQIKNLLKNIEYQIPSLHSLRIPGRGIVVIDGFGKAIQVKNNNDCHSNQSFSR